MEKGVGSVMRVVVLSLCGAETEFKEEEEVSNGFHEKIGEREDASVQDDSLLEQGAVNREGLVLAAFATDV